MSGKEIKPIPENEMVDLEALKLQKFQEKHPPLTDEQKEQAKKESRDAQKQYTRDQTEIEKNLLKYLSREEPLLGPNGDVLAWVRDIPYFKLLDMIPERVFLGVDINESTDPKVILDTLKGEQTEYVFKLMEELITIPKKNWQEWKTLATKPFITAFNDHLEKIMKQATDEVRFF